MFGIDASCSRVAIPAHHMGLFMYTNPSPSKPCRSSACNNPCACCQPRCSRLSVRPVERRLPPRAVMGRRGKNLTFLVMTKLVPAEMEASAEE